MPSINWTWITSPDCPTAYPTGGSWTTTDTCPEGCSSVAPTGFPMDRCGPGTATTECNCDDCECGDDPPDPDPGCCGALTCEENETCCNETTCVLTSSFQTDTNNCGGCDIVCDPGETCVDGACTGGGGDGCCYTAVCAYNSPSTPGEEYNYEIVSYAPASTDCSTAVPNECAGEGYEPGQQGSYGEALCNEGCVGGSIYIWSETPCPCCITYGLITTAYAYTEADLSARTAAVITAATQSGPGNCTPGTANTPGDPEGWSVSSPGPCPCYGCGFSTWEYAGGGIWNMLSDCSGSPSTPGLVCETSLDAGYFFSSPYEGLRVSLQCNCSSPSVALYEAQVWDPRPCSGSPTWWFLSTACPEGYTSSPPDGLPTNPPPCDPDYENGHVVESIVGCCEGIVQRPCTAVGGAMSYNPASQLAAEVEPCSQEECEAHVSTWMAEAYGEPNKEGLYKVKWILLDGCPGLCCSDQPTQPEFVKSSTLVDAPCKCGCN